MFSCCRCKNAKTDKNQECSKDNKKKIQDNEKNKKSSNDLKETVDSDYIVIRLKENSNNEIVIKENQSPTTLRINEIPNDIDTNDINGIGNERIKSDSRKSELNDDDDDDEIKLISKDKKSTVPSNDFIGTTTAATTTSTTNQNDTTSTTTAIYHQHVGDAPKSCISRRSSSKSSIRKKVNINDSTEVIPSSDLPSVDDDEVFSDSIPPKVPRGDMCAPYVTKRGSFQGYLGFLPEWFNEDRFYTTNEYGGVMEPPVTPVGRDELAMKRHRLYSELLLAAQAAVDHRVHFDHTGQDHQTNQDCDPDLKPSISGDLENLVNRLEKLVERLERSISARELETANKTFDSVIEKKRHNFDIEYAHLPPIPSVEQPTKLEKRINCISNTLNRFNDSFKKDSSELSGGVIIAEGDSEGSLENIPTVLDEYLTEDMSVAGYQDIVCGPLAQYLQLSSKIGGDVAKHSQFVKNAFDAQLQYIILATQCAQPAQPKQMELLKPTSDQIAAIQEFREKNRTSKFFNHLSAISESIPALGWVCVSPTPGPHVKEMNDAGQFYTNRVLKDWKEKDPTHVEWARSWGQTLSELQKFIKQYHTTGLVWSGKGGAPSTGGPPPPPSLSGCPPPPPPPVLDLASMNLNAGAPDERSALFAEINRGSDVTRGLKKVTQEMQTHKNPTLRTGPAPFKTPNSFTTGSVSAPVVQADKPPVFNKDGKKWTIEYQKSNPNLLIDDTEMNNVVYMFKCQNSTLTVKGKINSVFMDSCKKCSLLFDSVVSSIEFVNCQSVQMQVLQKCPTISIDKTDGCQMYLSKDSLDVEIINSKSSEMNVLIPNGSGDYTEQAIPEQYKTIIKGRSLQTTCVESLG